MDEKLIEKFIDVIREESRAQWNRMKTLPDQAQWDEWVFSAGPELRLMAALVLTAIYHMAEARLKVEVALLTDDHSKRGTRMTNSEIRHALDRVRKYRIQDIKKKIKRITQRNIESRSFYDDFETLRLFANAWKHQPEDLPSAQLVKHLGLPHTSYRRGLTRGEEIFESLAGRFNLDAWRIADVVEEFLRRSQVFLASAKDLLAQYQRKYPDVDLLDDYSFIA